MNIEGLWIAREVAAYMNCSVSWVYSHGADGTLPSVKIGGLRRFDPEQIRAYARDKMVPAARVVAFPGKGR